MLAVVGHIMFGSIGTHHGEIDIQFFIALCQEVVAHRTCHTTLVVALFIEKTVKSLLRIRCNKLRILKLHQDNQTILLTRICR